MPTRPGWSRTAVLALLLIFLMGIVGVLEPRFFSLTNLLNVVRQSSIIGVVALGMTVVILTGGIDLSVGSVLALGALAGAGAAKAGWGAPLAWGGALGVGALLGAANGLGVGRLRLPPFIVTLGMMGVARGMALLATEGSPISGLGPAFRFPGAGWFLGIPVPVWLFGGALGAVFVLLERTAWGEGVRSVGSNVGAAWGAGIAVPRVLFGAYVLSGVLAALAGIVLGGRLDAAQPTAGLGYEFGAIAAVVLGGTSFSGGQGSLSGTVLGVFILGVLENGMNLLNVNPFAEPVVKGVIIALALVFYGRMGSRIRA